MSSLTSANAVIALGITGLFPTPQRLQGFSADNIFGTEDQEIAQTSMGVDGKLSGGFVFEPVKWNVELQADSDSNFLFDQWAAQQRVQRDAFVANGTVILTALGTKWTMTRGFLTSYKPMPDAKKILQPRRYVITWQSVLPASA